MILVILFITGSVIASSKLQSFSALYDQNKNIIINESTGELFRVVKRSNIFSEFRLLEAQAEKDEARGGGGGQERITPDDSRFYVWIGISIGLTLFAGLMSGLTVGYLSIDDLKMEIKLKSGTDKEIKAAKRVLPILQRHHWLLVTLLLANAAAMEALPLFLDAIMPAVFAVIISVTAVLFFGEIIPQAVCTGPDQIQIAAKIAPVTSCLMIVLSPISYPISLCLDCCLGKHKKPRFDNKDLKELISLHSRQELLKSHVEDEPNVGLENSQTDMMLSVIDLKQDCADSIAIKPQNMYSLSSQMVYNGKLAKEIKSTGFSRIPIYLNNNANLIVGVHTAKNLLGVAADGKFALGELNTQISKPLVVTPKTNLLEVLHKFKKGGSRFAIVTEEKEQLEKLISKFQYGQISGKEGDLNQSTGSWEWSSGSVGGSFEKDAFSINRAASEIGYPRIQGSIRNLGFFTMQDVLEHLFNQQAWNKVVKSTMKMIQIVQALQGQTIRQNKDHQIVGGRKHRQRALCKWQFIQKIQAEYLRLQEVQEVFVFKRERNSA